MLQRWGMLNWNKPVSCSAACPVIVFRHVRNGTSRFSFLSNARYPCIMALKPMAPMVLSGVLYFSNTSLLSWR